MIKGEEGPEGKSAFSPAGSAPAQTSQALPLTSGPSRAAAASVQRVPTASYLKGDFSLSAAHCTVDGVDLPELQSDHSIPSLENPPRASPYPPSSTPNSCHCCFLPGLPNLTLTLIVHHIPLSSNTVWGTLPTQAMSLSLCPCCPLGQLLLDLRNSSQSSPPPGSLP